MVNLGTLAPRVASSSSARASHAELNILISGGTGIGQDDAAERALVGDPGVASASSRSRTRPSSSCTSGTCSASSRARRTSRARAQVAIRDLVRNSLRMRPDRIIVGEVRGAEALDMLQAMNTGHDGSLSTVHANSPRDALARVETMVLMAGFDLPVRAIRAAGVRPRST